MITFKEQLVQVIFASVTVLNGRETEEDLNMLISETIARENLEEIKRNLVTEQLESEMDTEETVDKGVFVYNYKSLADWTFSKHATVADAVREAVKMINATIISNGSIITYDTIDDDSAYYVDDTVGKVKIVQLYA